MQNHPPVQPGPDSPPPAGPVSTGLAVTSMVLGIVAIIVCPLLGIVAVILGIVALTRAGREPHRYGGKGMAIAGVMPVA